MLWNWTGHSHRGSGSRRGGLIGALGGVRSRREGQFVEMTDVATPKADHRLEMSRRWKTRAAAASSRRATPDMSPAMAQSTPWSSESECSAQ